MTNDSGTDSLVEAGYDAVHAAMSRSPTLLRIWREQAMGEDFPEDFWHISFATVDELNRMAEALSLRSTSTLVDLGCGTGGPGLYLAHQTGARLTGLDLSSVAVRIAADRAERLRLAGTHFIKGSFTETGLPTASADAAVSFDAIQYAPSKAAAFAEIARVLRPAGRLAFTAFELDAARAGSLPVIGADPIEDYRSLLESAGFTVPVYEETQGWEDRLNGAYSAILDAKETLVSEMGALAATALMSEVTVTLEHRPYRRRVFCMAQLG